MRVLLLLTLLSSLSQSNILKRAWETYPLCTRELCLRPINQIDTCASSNRCACLSVPLLSKIASCVGTFCPDDSSTVLGLLKKYCKADNNYVLPLDENAWIKGTELQWTSAAMGIFTTPAPSLPDTTYNYGIYPDCTEYLCMVPSTWYFTEISNARVCPSVQHIAVYAACVGKLCPNDTTLAHSTVQQACKGNGGFDIPMSFAQWVEASRKDPLDAYNSLLVHLSSTALGLSATKSKTVLAESTQTKALTTSQGTTTQTSAPTVSSEVSINAISRSDSISLGVGLGVGIPTIILASLGVWYQRKRTAKGRANASVPSNEY